MGIVQPYDGYAIYEFISPGELPYIWKQRLDLMKSAGFSVVLNYALLASNTNTMLAYIIYAGSIGLKVAISLKDIWQQANLSVAFPALYSEAGSPGITNYNAFATYIVNQVKSLSGTWGYYIADEPADTSHASVLAFYGYITAADNTRPILLISTGDTSTGTTFWFQNCVFFDCCTVGGDSHYINGLTNRADDPATVAQGTQAYCTLKGIASATVLQANNSPGAWPTNIDQITAVQQTTAHMQAKLIIYYAFYVVWGTPTAWLGFGPVAVSDQPTLYWSNLLHAISYRSQYAQTILTDTPLNYYRLDDQAACTFFDDLAGTNQTASPTALTRTTSLLTGDSDGAMSFNGATSKCVLPIAGLPVGNHAYSLECKISMASIPGGGNYPFALGLGSDVVDEQLGLYFDGDQQRLACTMKNHSVFALAAPTIGVVYHLVGTYSTTGLVSFYVNGALQGTMNRTLNMIFGTATIGVDPSGTLFWINNGVIDEVALYGYVLSPGQVKTHYQASLNQYTGGSALPIDQNWPTGNHGIFVQHTKEVRYLT